MLGWERLIRVGSNNTDGPATKRLVGHEKDAFALRILEELLLREVSDRRVMSETVWAKSHGYIRVKLYLVDSWSDPRHLEDPLRLEQVEVGES